MRNKLARIYMRRVDGPRRSKIRLTLRPPVLFVLLGLISAALGLWLNDQIKKAEIATQSGKIAAQTDRVQKP